MAVVARTYARALFEAAKDAGRIDEVRDQLTTFVEAVDEVPELRSLIRNPELDPLTKAAALDAVLEGADELIRNFVRVVTRRGAPRSSTRSRASTRCSSPRRSRS